MSLPILARNRGGSFAAGPAAPAGGGPYALDVSNEVTVTPVAHWDASMMTGSDNTGWSDTDTVSESTADLWQDRTGNFALRGHATAADQPIFVASFSSLNDKPAVDITLASSYFYETDNSATKTLVLSYVDGWTIYIAAYQGSATTYGVLFNANVSEGGGTGYYRWQQYQNTSLIVKAYGDAPNSGNISQTIGSVNEKRFIEGITSTESSNGTVRTKRDGDGSFEVDTDTSGYSFDMKFADMNHGADANRFKGHIAEMIFFDEALDATDTAAVESYLGTKYDI